MRVCIIGSGPAGSILALELSKQEHTAVVLIDCDSVRKDFTKGLELAKIVSPNIARRKTVGYGFGGTSNLWHGVLTCLDEEDWAAGEYGRSDCSEIKEDLQLRSLERYFGPLEELSTASPAVSRSALKNWIELEDLLPKRYIVQRRPTRFRRLILERSNQAAGGLDLIENAIALTLNLGENSQVVSVEYVVDGMKRVSSADIFVVCAGALETPRILKQSFAGTRFDNELVGVGLMDHPFCVIGEVTIPNYIMYQEHGFTPWWKGRSARTGYRVPRHLRSDPILNHSIFLMPLVGGDAEAVKDMMNAIVYGHGDIFKIIRRSAFSLKFWSALMTLAVRKFGFPIYVRRFLVSVQLEQTRADCSNVKISNLTDKYGRLIPEITWLLTPKYKAELERIQTLLASLCKNSATFKPRPIKDADLEPGAHHAGTCRLSQEREKGVVDLNLKHHDLGNLFVCDASILPKIGNANLTLTLGLFAERLARHIRTINLPTFGG